MFVDQVQRNRFELKYLIDARLASVVRDFARCHMVRDRYARPEMAWCYPIYSIYLDSPDRTLCRATQDGLRNRFKLRLRYYDMDPAKPVFCEIKRRVNDVILKERAMLQRSAATRLLAGGIVNQSDLVDPADLKAFSSLSRFGELQRATVGRGLAFVTYFREAWNSPQDNSVRLTFDTRVRGAWYGGSLDLPQEWAYPQCSSQVVLELKFNGRFPIWMRELVQSCNLLRTGVAKYVSCMELLRQDSRLGRQVDANEDADGD